MIRQTNFRTLIVKICRMLHRMSRSKCVHICYVGLVGCHHYYHYICINMDQQGKKTDGSHQLKMSWSPIITINDPPAWFACRSISDGNSPSIKRVAESATMCEQWHATYHYRVSSTCEIWSVIAMQNSKNVYAFDVHSSLPQAKATITKQLIGGKRKWAKEVEEIGGISRSTVPLHYIIYHISYCKPMNWKIKFASVVFFFPHYRILCSNDIIFPFYHRLLWYFFSRDRKLWKRRKFASIMG